MPIVVSKEAYHSTVSSSVSNTLHKIWDAPPTRIVFDWLVPPVNFVIAYACGLTALGFSVYAFQDGAECLYPLTLWLMVTGFIHMISAAFPVTRFLISCVRVATFGLKTTTPQNKRSIQRAASYMDFFSMLFSLILLAWYVVGAAWFIASSKDAIDARVCPRYQWIVSGAYALMYAVRLTIWMPFFIFFGGFFCFLSCACCVEYWFWKIPQIAARAVELVYRFCCCIFIPCIYYRARVKKINGQVFSKVKEYLPQRVNPND